VVSETGPAAEQVAEAQAEVAEVPEVAEVAE
jgi:hypothetical protein